MQISKSLLVVCAAVCVIPLLSGRGADNAAQAKAREALEKKLKELDSQAPGAARQETVAPQAEQPKVSPPSAAAVIPQADPETIAKARAAMRQKMSELQGQQPGAAPRTAAVIQPEAAPQASPVVQPADQLAPGARPAADPETIAKARESLHQKLRQLQVQESAEAQAQAEAELGPKADPETLAKARAALAQRLNELQAEETVQARKSAEAERRARAEAETGLNAEKNTRARTAGLEEKHSKKIALKFPPLEAPTLPISAEKHQRLEELLQKYKADEITPEQYHSQRAQILAEP